MDQGRAEFFTEAAAAVGLMAQKVTTLAEMFRRNDLKAANDGLMVLSSELGDLVATIGAVQGPLAVDPARLVVDGVPPDEQIARLGAWVEQIVEAQGAEDWMTIADILEYDLEPLVSGWTAVLQDCADAS